MEVFEIRRFTFACLCVGVAVLANTVPASGGSSLRFTDYPSEVPFGEAFQIKGQGPEGSFDSVSLQRRFPQENGWNRLQTKTPNGSGHVSFSLEKAKYTAEYRLKSGDQKSEAVRILVQPKLTLTVKRPDVMRGKNTIVKGALRPTWSNRQAVLKMKRSGEWRTVDVLKLADGDFRQKLPVNRVGRHRIKVIFERDVRNSYARAASVVRGHDPDMATWYGPGFFGNRTACGQTYHRELLGVAHRSLPCGTKVSVLYKGRSVKVPVVDRGPYGHAELGPNGGNGAATSLQRPANGRRPSLIGLFPLQGFTRYSPNGLAFFERGGLV